jgi:hypothetical protein
VESSERKFGRERGGVVENDMGCECELRLRCELPVAASRWWFCSPVMYVRVLVCLVKEGSSRMLYGDESDDVVICCDGIFVLV